MEYQAHHLAGNSSILASAVSETLLREEGLGLYSGTVYSLGCGAGDLLGQIGAPPGTHFVGVDFSKDFLTLCSDRMKQAGLDFRGIEADLRTWSPPDSHDASLILCVNVIPYLKDLTNLFEVAASISGGGVTFLLLYPLRSPVWEDSFEGVSLVFHSPDEVSFAATTHGSHLIKRTPVSFRMALPPFWPERKIAMVDLYQLGDGGNR